MPDTLTFLRSIAEAEGAAPPEDTPANGAVAPTDARALRDKLMADVGTLPPGATLEQIGGVAFVSLSAWAALPALTEEDVATLQGYGVILPQEED